MITTRTFLCAAALAAIGCASGGTQVVGLTTTSAASASGGHVCPMAVPGTSARATSVPGGAVLELTTTGSDADAQELARRVHLMAARGSFGRMAGPGGGIGVRGTRQEVEPAPSADVRVDDIAHGARVTLLARDRAQIDLLRARVQAHASRMGSGDCGR